MIVIRCPYCQEERHEEELTYGGEAELIRPAEPEAVTDEVWTDYLYFRTNTKGPDQEQWCCASGCGLWFKVTRDSVSHKVLEVVCFEQKLAAAGQP